MITGYSKVFHSIGLGSVDLGILILIIFILLIILIFLTVIWNLKVSRLKKRLDKLTAGKEASSLEKEILQLFEDNRQLKTDVEKNRKNIRNILSTLTETYQKMGLVKYDAFNQMGGHLSFCLAMLNEKDDGFIINSVHSSDGCYVYTKEIKSGYCDLDLGNEESEALSQAIHSIQPKK